MSAAGSAWRMPAETDRHERTWMAWPTTGYTLGDTVAEAESARATWAAVAHAVSEAEPVTMVVDPRDAETVRRHLSAAIDVLVAPLDDAWMRDIGPTFVTRTNEQGRPELGAVDWEFNGWGGQSWARWERDRHVASIVAGAAGAVIVGSELVNEGGGIHVDGAGTVLATSTVQLDPGRNPGWSRDAVAAEFRRVLGADTTVWLPRGLTRDAERFGTRGHVDIVATFAAPGILLVHDQRNEAHPDAAVCREIRAVLESARDAAGRRFELIDVPAPEVLRDDEGWVDYSYINHLVAGDSVISCAFGDPGDATAAAILADAYPGRRVVQVDARPLFSRGGGVHCITQQQPALT